MSRCDGPREARFDRLDRADDEIVAAAGGCEKRPIRVERPVSFELIVRCECVAPDAHSGRGDVACGDCFPEVDDIEPPAAALNDVLHAREPAGFSVPLHVLVERTGPNPMDDYT